MARIKPFKGIRPPKDLIEQVASRPYDVLNSEEAREEAKGTEKFQKNKLKKLLTDSTLKLCKELRSEEHTSELQSR